MIVIERERLIRIAHTVERFAQPISVKRAPETQMDTDMSGIQEGLEYFA